MTWKKFAGGAISLVAVSGLGLWGLLIWADRVEQQQAAAVVAANDNAAATLAQGKQLGYAAAVSGQSAISPGQWVAVADQWQAAVDVLESIPREAVSYAEAQAKATEYRENKIAALRRKSAAEQAMGTDAERFMDWVRSVDEQGLLVSSATVDPEHPETVEVTVTTAFLAQPVALQREGAAGLQAGWATIYSPTAPDDALLWLRTPSGRRFGGSRAIAGSMIYIDP